MTKPTRKRRQPNSTLPARTKPIQRANASPGSRKPRPKAESVRIYGTPEHIAWMKSLPCAFCGVVGYSVCAHVRNGGKGRKANWEYTVPACENVPMFFGRFFGIRPGCHHDFDHNKRTWRAKYDTDALAAKYVTLWRRHLAAVGPTPQEDR